MTINSPLLFCVYFLKRRQLVLFCSENKVILVVLTVKELQYKKNSGGFGFLSYKPSLKFSKTDGHNTESSVS